MRLYYTGAKAAGDAQTQPSLSIGGYVSGSMVPSGLEGTLFGNPSQAEILEGGTSYILLALTNTSGTDYPDVSIYYTQASQNLFSLEMGAVIPATDSCDDPVFESTINFKAQPVGITFSNPIGSENAISLGEMLNGATIGIWIKRTINTDAGEFFLGCDNLYAAFEDDSIDNAQKDFPFDISIVANDTVPSSLITGGVDPNFTGTINFTQVGGIGIQTGINFTNGVIDDNLDYFTVSNPDGQEYIVSPQGFTPPGANNLTFIYNQENVVILT